MLMACFCLSASTSFSQITEKFSYKNLNDSLLWDFSSSVDWKINPDFQLQSNCTISNSSFWISRKQQISDSIQWEIDIHLLFNPSSANYVDIFLTASHENLTDPELTGYFLRLGNTDDEIALYRKDAGNKIIKIIDGLNGLLNKSENKYRLKVTRRSKEEWAIWHDASLSGNAYISGGTGTDSIYLYSKYFGILIRQSTESFHTKHLIDNIDIKPFIPDQQSPAINALSILDKRTLAIQFDETVTILSAINKENYFINNGVGQPMHIKPDSTFSHTFICILDPSFENKQTYEIKVKNIQDLSGNIMADTIISFLFYTPEKGDIVLNEILFNPVGSESDYVEIYNHSLYPINLKGYKLANINSNGGITNTAILFDEDQVIAPGACFVFTDDRQSIMRSFKVNNPHQLFELDKMPSLPNEEGHVILIETEGNIIDALAYQENWHFPLLNQREGVALERISTSRPTQLPDNWMSASKSSGYGTPTEKNSQMNISNASNSVITLNTEIFSPDQDGHEDLLLINYQLPEGGYVLNCMIFDAAGRPIRTLQKNMLCGLAGTFRWDGLDDQMRQLPMGYYIVFTEIFHPTKGKIIKHKKEVVLARQR